MNIRNNQSTVKVIADTGSSGHHINSSTPQLPLSNHPYTLPTVRLPDGNTITASHAAMLPLPQELSQAASTAYSFQSIVNPLISIEKLCDDDCVALFTKKHCFVLKNNHVHLPTIQANAFMMGNRDHDSKLWTFSLKHQP